jgi:hypothetical protein
MFPLPYQEDFPLPIIMSNVTNGTLPPQVCQGCFGDSVTHTCSRTKAPESKVSSQSSELSYGHRQQLILQWKNGTSPAIQRDDAPRTPCQSYQMERWEREGKKDSPWTPFEVYSTQK